MVFVVDAEQRPLGPCHPARARKLLTAGKAAVWRRYPFAILLKRKVPDAAPASLHLQIDPGSKVTGLALASRWEPSSKMCSACGWYDADLTLSDRVFVCRNPARIECGLVLDRDLNAAINLRTLAGSSSESRNACGVGSAGRGGELR